jgi:multidrug efflux pump subunit AcrB
MSVTGMIIALGLLIDNAIVAVDEVSTSIRRGVPRIDAVRDMVGHLAIPLAGSTATTALAFAPIAMMPGNAGEFVGSIAISVIIAIAASLVFALTVIPVVASRFIPTASPAERRGAFSRAIDRGISSERMLMIYRRVVTWLLAKPHRGVLAGLILPAIGFAVAPRLPEQFFPPADRDQFHVQVELPVDASIDATRAAAEQVSELLDAAGAVKVSWYFGESAPMFYYNVLNNRRGVPNFANAIVQMETAEGIGDVLRRLQTQADRAVPQARVLFRQLEQGPPFDAPIEVQLFGPDIERLRGLGEQVRVALAESENVIHTAAQLNETLPTAIFDVREADARLVGMSPESVSEQLFDLLEGVPAGSVLEDTEQIPVHVRVGDARRTNLQSIAALQLHAGEDRFPVESLAEARLQGEIAVIPRLNGRRMNLISGFVTAGTLPSVAIADFERRLSAVGFRLPPGYEMDYGGEASQRDDAVGNLMANVGTLAVIMVAVLVLSFGSFRLAVMILMVAVCSGGLGMLALWVGGYPFGFMAIIGIMGLIGVAINDSIVVLAALQAGTAAGRRGLGQAVETVIKSTRHVVATTLTTIAGFTPLILDGGQFWPPLAVAIAGGVGGATLLALIFVPAVYRRITSGERDERHNGEVSSGVAEHTAETAALAG